VANPADAASIEEAEKAIRQAPGLEKADLKRGERGLTVLGMVHETDLVRLWRALRRIGYRLER
jgi:hypothetical protein